MLTDWNPTRPAFLDFETQSEYDLNRGTVRGYAAHPSTRVLTCVAKVDGVVHLFPAPFDADSRARLASVVEGCTPVAHNAPFDSAVWERVLGLPSVPWFDTVPPTRMAGLPGGLDQAGKALFGAGKDKNGARLVDMLCVLKPGRKAPAVGAAHELLLEYNLRDVELLEQLYWRVKPFVEPEVMAVDRIVNDRGVPVCRRTLETLAQLMAENREEAADEFYELTGSVSPNSHKKLKEWLAERGFKFGSINKSAVLNFMARPEEFYVGEDEAGGAIDAVRDMLLLRKEVVGVGVSKVQSALQVLDDDDRVHDALVYGGAGPGRWSSRRVQFHNLPSTVSGGLDIKTVPLTASAMREAARVASEKSKEHVSVAQLLSQAVRTVVRTDNLLVADYAAVEARGVAWVSGCSTMLELYEAPTKSLYLDMGRRVFGRELDKKKDFLHYSLAKSIILGCGYNMSGGKFEYTLALRNVPTTPLKEAGLTPQICVKMYREAYPEIPAVWKAYHDAAHACVAGEDSYAGRCEFRMVGPDMHMVLPSGRPVVYRNAGVEMLVPGYCRMYGMPEVPVPTVCYDHPRGYRGFLYGGKICENAVQALCRDLLAESLVRAEQVGLRPALHVHDELVCEAPPDRLGELLQLMSDGPAWSRGMPLLVEGYSGPVWTKNPAGYAEGKALDGRLL